MQAQFDTREPVIVGQGVHQYEVEQDWDRLPDCLRLHDVAGIAVDSEDHVYVFNRGHHPLIIYDSEGRAIRSWGHGLFSSAHGITITEDDSVFLTDNHDHTVRKFTKYGRLLLTLGTGQPSDSGAGRDYRSVRRGAPPFNGCTNVAVSANGDIYVSDGYGNARIHCFNSEGELKFSWGGPGIAPGQFNLPHSLAIDDEGRVYVCDRENDRIQIFDSRGAYIESWSPVFRPDDIVIDPDGFVFVAELGHRAGRFPDASPPKPTDPVARIVIFDPDGNLVSQWGGPDPVTPGSFFAPHGMCIDSRSDIYVGEVNWSAGGARGQVPQTCHTLQKFKRLAPDRTL